MPEDFDNTASPTPGDILKRCREFHGMTLEEAAEATKISIGHLQALEENRCSQFSSLTYLKGFARIYATSLGLSADDIIRLYARQYGTEEQTGGTSQPHPMQKKKGHSRFPLQKLAMPVVLFMLLLITSAIINRSPDPQISRQITKPVALTQTVQATLSSSRSQPTAPEAKKQHEEITAENQEPAPKEAATLPTEEAHKGFIVSLKINRNSSLTVTVDATEPQLHEMTAGDRIEWRGSNQITLELSDAGAVEAQLNGKPLAPLGIDGAHKTVTVREDGIK